MANKQTNELTNKHTDEKGIGKTSLKVNRKGDTLATDLTPWELKRAVVYPPNVAA